MKPAEKEAVNLLCKLGLVPFELLEVAISLLGLETTISLLPLEVEISAVASADSRAFDMDCKSWGKDT